MEYAESTQLPEALGEIDKDGRVTDEWELVRRALGDAGVSGVQDFGRFVNNTEYFEPARLDAVAAGPVLLALLPSLSDRRVVAAVGRHLQHPSARKLAGYPTVKAAFLAWAREPGETGWVLGDTLARMADRTNAADMLAMAMDRDLGSSRAFIVGALWRFRSSIAVEPALRGLIGDESVALMAMSSLQRVIGRDQMIPALQELVILSQGSKVAELAARKLRKLAGGGAERPSDGRDGP